MIDSTRPAGLGGALETWGVRPGASQIGSDPSFNQQLGEAIAQTLRQFGIDPNSVQVSIHRVPDATQGQKVGAEEQPRQIPVTSAPAAAGTVDLLTGDITAEQLRSVEHPAALLRARLALVRRPTPAYYLNLIDGNKIASDPGHLSMKEDAEAMLVRLRRLGLSGGEVREVIAQTPFSRLEFAGDPRRDYYIGNLNVGLLLERYAKYPIEVADEMTKAELQDAAVVRSA